MREAKPASESADSAEEKPFEQVLGEKGETKDAPSTTKPEAKVEPHAEEHAPELGTQPEPGAEVLAPAPLVAPLQAAPPKAPPLRADALALPSVAAAAPASAPSAAQEPARLEATPDEPARELEPAALPQPEASASRDAALLADHSPLSEARSEVQPAAAPKAPAPVPTAPAAPADHERAGEILRQMRVQFSPELRTATIQLSPPELGRISIRVRVERGEMHALVRAEKRETLEALERHVPELKATLEQLGIQARVFDLQLGFEQREARPDAQHPQPAESAAAADEHDPRQREHARRLARTLVARAGGIDTYA